MIYKDFSIISEKERYKLTKGSVIPRPIAWISTISDNGTVNLAPFSYFNMVSTHHLMVSILRKENGMKDTAKNLLKNKEAVVHIATKNLLEIIDETGKEKPYGESEVDLEKLTLVESERVKVSGIAEAFIRFEVNVKESHSLESDGSIISDIFIFEILGMHISDEVYDAEHGYILSEQLEPIARLGGPEYAKIEKIDYQRKF